jgi:hypothetical protein
MTPALSQKPEFMASTKAMLAATLTGEQGFVELALFFDMQRQECSGATGDMGCMAINAQTEMGRRDDKIGELAGQYRGVLTGRLRPLFATAAERGEIDASMVDTYVDMLLAFTVSLAVAARSGASTDELLRQIDSMERLANTWRL